MHPVDQKRGAECFTFVFVLLEPKTSQALPVSQGKIEIVASKRQQKQQQAAAAMPPPPSRLLAPSRSVTATSMHAGADSSSGFCIQISKGGEAVQDVPLTKQCILLGRCEKLQL